MQSHEVHDPAPESAKPEEHASHFLDEEDSVDVENGQLGRQELYNELPHTILADVTSNRMFLGWQARITLALMFIILFLKALPSPLIISIVENDPQVFTQEPCTDTQSECSEVEEGYESILIKKVNPFQRELKYFIKLNFQKFEELNRYFGNKNVDLNQEVTWIEIFAYRNGEKYGPVIYEKQGQDIYEILFDNQALIFIGEVHVLEEQSYFIKIYKIIRKYKVPALRMLQGDTQNNQTLVDNSTSTSNGTTEGEAVPTQQQKKQQQRKQQQNKQQQKKKQQQQKKKKQQQQKKKQQQKKQQKLISLSIPLTVEMVRYSQFYTAVQLIIRYVTLLAILYVRAQTPQSPKIFHYILILTSNPLIFIEIALPNNISNVISAICSSMYIAYLGVFLYYCHRKLINHRADLILKVGKGLTFLGLWVASIMRQLHLVNQTKVQFFQYILIVIVLIPLVHHLWKLYFLKSKTIIHRNMLFISHTVYYLLVLFFSGYLVSYGWKKISFYFIVQIYGCQLCYLTSPYLQNKEEEQMKLKTEQEISQPYNTNVQATHKITEEREEDSRQSNTLSHFQYVIVQ